MFDQQEEKGVDPIDLSPIKPSSSNYGGNSVKSEPFDAVASDSTSGEQSETSSVSGNDYKRSFMNYNNKLAADNHRILQEVSWSKALIMDDGKKLLALRSCNSKSLLNVVFVYVHSFIFFNRRPKNKQQSSINVQPSIPHAMKLQLGLMYAKTVQHGFRLVLMFVMAL